MFRSMVSYFSQLICHDFPQDLTRHKFNGNFRIRLIGGTYNFLGLNFRESPQKIWPKIWHSTVPPSVGSSNSNRYNSPITMVYGIYHYSYWGESKPQDLPLTSQAPHLDEPQRYGQRRGPRPGHVTIPPRRSQDLGFV